MKHPVRLSFALISLAFGLLLAWPESSAIATEDNPDFLIAFTGDIQGYLEECG